MAPRRYAPRKKVYRKKYGLRYRRRRAIKDRTGFPMYNRPVRTAPPTMTLLMKYGTYSRFDWEAVTQASVQNFRFDPWDVLPSTGTTPLAGFDIWGMFYKKYRVMSCGFVLHVCNREEFPCAVTTQITRTVATDGVDVIGNVGNPLAKTMQLSSTFGMDRGTLSGYYKVNKVFGSNKVFFNAGWEGDTQPSGGLLTTLTNPLWLNIGVNSQTAGTTAGADYSVVLSMVVRFSELREL